MDAAALALVPGEQNPHPRFQPAGRRFHPPGHRGRSRRHAGDSLGDTPCPTSPPRSNRFRDGRSRHEEIHREAPPGIRGARTGRATGNLLDHIKVEYYGSHVTPMKQVAAVSVPDGRTIESQTLGHRVPRGH
jgi:hypothetical protein